MNPENETDEGVQIEIEPLTGDAAAYAPFTFASAARRLQQLDPPWFAVGLNANGTPAGLALGNASDGHGLLVSLQIDKAHRGRGLGTALLRAWGDEAVRRGAERLWCRYTDSLPRRAAFERTLAACDWEPAIEESYVLRGYAGRMGRAGGAWAGVRERVLRRTDLTYEPLVLHPEDEADLATLRAQQPAQGLFGPARYAAKMIPELSLAIRLQGKLIGWIIATPGALNLKDRPEMLASVLVDYPESYVDEARWNTGAVLGAYYHCFLRQAEMYGEDSIASYRTHPGVPHMVAFTKRRFAPMALIFNTVLRAAKHVTK